MHYRTVTLTHDRVCRHCGEVLPSGSNALRLLSPRNHAYLLGFSHVNDCLRFPSLPKRP